MPAWQRRASRPEGITRRGGGTESPRFKEMKIKRPPPQPQREKYAKRHHARGSDDNIAYRPCCLSARRPPCFAGERRRMFPRRSFRWRFPSSLHAAMLVVKAAERLSVTQRSERRQENGAAPRVLPVYLPSSQTAISAKPAHVTTRGARRKSGREQPRLPPRKKRYSGPVYRITRAYRATAQQEPWAHV